MKPKMSDVLDVALQQFESAMGKPASVIKMHPDTLEDFRKEAIEILPSKYDDIYRGVPIETREEIEQGRFTVQ